MKPTPLSWGVKEVGRFLDEFYDAETFERLIADDASVFAVADDDNGVGFVVAGPEEGTNDTFHLTRVYVRPDSWGQGIGQKLLAWAENRVRDRGAGRLTLGVMAENDRAVAFYEAAGYRQADEFYDDRIDTPGYTYEKEL